jgi:HicB_like antitoxin of bacterial toxin-antitoxin system
VDDVISVSCPRRGIERCPRGSRDKSPKSRVGGEYGKLHLSYTGLIDGKAGAYGVVFPNFPGCVAIGATIDEAVRNAADAMCDSADVTVETVAPCRSRALRRCCSPIPKSPTNRPRRAAQERTAGAIVGLAGQGQSVDRRRHTRGDRRGSETTQADLVGLHRTDGAARAARIGLLRLRCGARRQPCLACRGAHSQAKLSSQSFARSGAFEIS